MDSYLFTIFNDLQGDFNLRKGNLNMKPINIAKIYNNYLDKVSETELEEIRMIMPEDKIYSGSQAGMCSRKIYYKSIAKATKTEEINSKTMRVFRIGTLIHKDLQDALELTKQQILKEK
mgnify:FL=1